jgi:hypothetical protein
MPDLPDDDSNPVVTLCIDEVLAPYRDILPRELLGDFAETLDIFLTTHPVAAQVVEDLRPRPATQFSTERDRGDTPVVADVVKPSGTEGR